MTEQNYVLVAPDWDEAGYFKPIKAWVKGVELEKEAEEQLRNVAQMPFIYKHIAVMPDVHWGMGATIGSVIPTRGAIIPAAVGVDIGCVDAETEFLTPFGWKSIACWDEEDQVCVFDPETGKGYFTEADDYIILPSDGFYKFKTKYGVDQMLSKEHRILFYRYDRTYEFNESDIATAEEIVIKHNETNQGWRHRILTCFDFKTIKSHDISDEDLRVAIMVAADGYIRNVNTRNCVLRFRKEKKFRRACRLLNDANITYSTRVNRNGDIVISIFQLTNLVQALQCIVKLRDVPQVSICLSFHAYNLFQSIYDVDQIFLSRHHRVYVFVRSRSLIDHVCVFSAFDSRGSGNMILHTKAFFSGCP